MSAESYAQANRNYLPKNVGEMRKVTLRTLVEDNYIEEVCYDDNNFEDFSDEDDEEEDDE